MELETSIYHALAQILETFNANPRNDTYVMGIILDFPNADPWQSVLFTVYDNLFSRKLRAPTVSKPRTTHNKTLDYWNCEEAGILWLTPEVDLVNPDIEGHKLRDGFLRCFETSMEPAALCREIIDVCVGVIQKLHTDGIAQTPQGRPFPIIIETLGADKALQTYARDRGLRANPTSAQDAYRAVLAQPEHDFIMANSVAKERSIITRANKISELLKEYVAICRSNNPIPKVSELSLIEKKQYQIIRNELASWLPKNGKRRSYLTSVFGTSKSGLTAFSELVQPDLRNIYCLSRHEFEEFLNRHKSRDWDETPTIMYRWHTFEPPNFNPKRKLPDGRDLSDRPIVANFPIPEGNLYFMEHKGYHLGPMHAAEDISLWEADDTEMTLIKKTVSSWIS